MKRKEFMNTLKEELRKRRDIESEEVLFYYDELIQDAVDNGENEEIFIANLGSARNIVRRLEDDKEFIVEVKNKNDIKVKNAVSTTIKVIGYFIMIIVGITVVSISFSFLASGIGVIGASIIKTVYSGPMDLYGYLVLLGGAFIGLSLIIFSIGLMKWFYNQAKPGLLSIFRNTKDFINRKVK